MDALTIQIPDQYPMTDDELFAFCAANKELRIERDEYGQLIIMSPTGSFTGNKNFRLAGMFWQWVERNPDLGYGFDSTAGFTLPDNSMRSPDVSWIKKERWESLTIEQQKKFAPICPDFVIELRSESDSLAQLKSKMKHWIKNGCQLAWLIDPIDEMAYVYTMNGFEFEVTGFDNTLDGGELLSGFQLFLCKLR